MKFKRNTLPLIVLALGTSGLLMAPGLVMAQGYEPLLGAASAAYSQADTWDAPPQEFREIQRQGFHDGIEGARKDFDNHRTPDVNNRDEYRHPKVPRSDRADYRDGYRRGYEVAMSHMTVGAGPR
jgi:hypothetical protein